MAAPFCHIKDRMPWNGTHHSWVGTGRTENMFFACTPYDPHQYAPIWYQRVGLAIICVANSLSIIAIILRTYFRWRKMKSFGKDDWWLIAAGVILVFIYFPALLVSNRMGSGLYVENIPFENRQALWVSMSGWAFYFIIASMIKIATCMYYLRIIPDHRVRLQRFVWIMSTAVMVVGLVQAGVWVLNCTPIRGNFIYNEENLYCPPVDRARWSWIVFSILIDSALLWIPWHILQHSGLPTAERRVLKLVFAANLLGTLTCVSNVYGVLTFDNGDDFTHSEAAFILINNGEVLMYVIGACFPVLSPYLVSLARSHGGGSRRKSSILPSWRQASPADADAHQYVYAHRESLPKRLPHGGLGIEYDDDDDDDENDELDTVLGSEERAVAVADSDEGRTLGALTPATVVVSLESGYSSGEGLRLSKPAKDDAERAERGVQVPVEAWVRPPSSGGYEDGVGVLTVQTPRRRDPDLERGLGMS